MKALFCDDNKAFADGLARRVTDYYRARDIPVAGTVRYAPQEVLALRDLPSYDAAFLDVSMTPINGIELGRRIKAVNPGILLIYISEFLEFALQGYTVNTFRYLLKNDLDTYLPICLDEIMQMVSPAGSFFEYKNRSDTLRVAYKDIYYFESDQRKINIYGAEPNKPVGSFNQRLSDLAESLPPNLFLQTGKSDLIHMRHIKKIVNYRVFLSNGVEKSVSRKDYSGIQARFIAWRGKL